MPDQVVNYEDVDEKYIYSLSAGSMFPSNAHTALISWLRTMCNLDGAVIGNVREARCESDCPLIEVEIRYMHHFTKVLISKATVYIVAYFYDGEWYALMKCGFKIIGAVDSEQSSRYQHPLCTKFGAPTLLGAIYSLNSPEPDQRKVGLEVLFVHLCEASRFRVVENQIALGFSVTKDEGFEPALEGEEELFEWVTKSPLPKEEKDMLSLIEPSGGALFYGDNSGVGVFNYLHTLIHKWRQLSKYWVAYCATGLLLFDTKIGSVFHNCRIKNLHLFRNCLGLLCCVNFETLGKEIKKRGRLDPRLVGSYLGVFSR